MSLTRKEWLDMWASIMSIQSLTKDWPHGNTGPYIQDLQNVRLRSIQSNINFLKNQIMKEIE